MPHSAKVDTGCRAASHLSLFHFKLVSAALFFLKQPHLFLDLGNQPCHLVFEFVIMLGLLLGLSRRNNRSEHDENQHHTNSKLNLRVRLD